MENFKKLMEVEVKKCSETQGSVLLTKEKFDEIVDHLKHPEKKVDPHLRHWVKKRNFALMNNTGLNLQDVLVIPNKKTQVNKFSLVLSI